MFLTDLIILIVLEKKAAEIQVQYTGERAASERCNVISGLYRGFYQLSAGGQRRIGSAHAHKKRVHR